MAVSCVCVVPHAGPTPSESLADKEPMARMVDNQAPIELSIVIFPSGKGTIKFYVESVHSDSRLHATQSS
jgi:hypothetical protein